MMYFFTIFDRLLSLWGTWKTQRNCKYSYLGSFFLFHPKGTFCFFKTKVLLSQNGAFRRESAPPSYRNPSGRGSNQPSLWKLRQGGGRLAGLQGPNETVGPSGIRLHFQSWSATRHFTSSFNLVATVCVFDRIALNKAIRLRTDCCFCNTDEAESCSTSRPGGLSWRCGYKRPFQDRS